MTTVSLWKVCTLRTLSFKKEIHYHVAIFCPTLLWKLPLIPWSLENHIDDSCHRSVVMCFLRLMLRLSIDRRMSRMVASKFAEEISSNHGFNFVTELNALFNVMTMIMVESIVLLPIAAPQWCLHRWGCWRYSFPSIFIRICMRRAERGV